MLSDANQGVRGWAAVNLVEQGDRGTSLREHIDDMNYITTCYIEPYKSRAVAALRLLGVGTQEATGK